MKTIRVFLLITFMSTMVAVSTASAQQTPTTGAERTENYDDNDRGGDYSWIGLLGLIGLAGLARRKDVSVNRSTTTPQTKYAP